MRRIADAKKWSAANKNRLEEIASHLGLINKLRNDILHYGVTIDLSAADAWLLSNKGFVHVPEKIRETSITPALLKDASTDLRKLFGLLITFTFYVLTPDHADGIQKQLESPLRLKSAWLYKSPPQAKRSDKSPKTRRKQPRQRPPSPEKP